jgi:hypothetical protein
MTKRIRNEREYDIIRKEETLKKLVNGIKILKDKKARKGDKSPVTKYALIQYTGVANKTINKYPEVLAMLLEEQNPGVELKKLAIKTGKIRTLDEAVMLLNELNDMYNDAINKANEFGKLNSKLNYDIVKLKLQVKELSNEIKRYRK